MMIPLTHSNHSGKRWTTRYRSKLILANAIAEGIIDGYEVRFLTSYNGPVVQLVRISACHAEGHEFESRLDRNYKLNTN